MGAHNFECWSTGLTMTSAYAQAVKNARKEFGCDPYNGTIATTDGVIDVTDDYRKSKLTLGAFQDKNIERAVKWGKCLGVCIDPPKKNTNRTKSSVRHHAKKGRLVWALKYEAMEAYSGWTIKICDTKADAVKAARVWTEKTQLESYVFVKRVLVQEDPLVASITYKRSRKEHLGNYVFFGWAAT